MASTCAGCGHRRWRASGPHPGSMRKTGRRRWRRSSDDRANAPIGSCAYRSKAQLRRRRRSGSRTEDRGENGKRTGSPGRRRDEFARFRIFVPARAALWTGEAGLLEALIEEDVERFHDFRFDDDRREGPVAHAFDKAGDVFRLRCENEYGSGSDSKAERLTLCPRVHPQFCVIALGPRTIK